MSEPQVPLVQPTAFHSQPPKPSIKARTKKLAKITFARVGVPVLVGSAAAYVASRKLDKTETQTEDPSFPEA